MKLTSNTIGLFIFIAISTTAFVYMAKRPVVEGNAMSFGMQMKAAESTSPKVIEEAATQETPSEKEGNNETKPETAEAEATQPEETATETTVTE